MEVDFVFFILILIALTCYLMYDDLPSKLEETRRKLRRVYEQKFS